MSSPSSESIRESYIARVAALYANIAPKLALVAMRRLKIDRQMAEDVIQDVFLRMIDDLQHNVVLQTWQDLLDDEGQSEKKLTSYLWVAILNGSRNVYRRTQRFEVRDQDLALLQIIDLSDEPLTEILENEQRAVVEELISRLHAALQELNEPYLTIFKMWLEGVSLAEISRRRGTNVKSIYQQFRRGIARLRSLMGER